MGAALDGVVIAVDVVATRRGSLVEESVFPVGEIVIDVTEVGAHLEASIILLVESVVLVAAALPPGLRTRSEVVETPDER